MKNAEKRQSEINEWNFLLDEPENQWRTVKLSNSRPKQGVDRNSNRYYWNKFPANRKYIEYANERNMYKSQKT